MGPDAKITLWAHDSHISRAYGGVMGKFIDEEIGDLYLPVGFGFSWGGFTARTGMYGNPSTVYINEIPVLHSINIIFHEASHPNFAFQLDAIPEDSHWASWLETPRKFLMGIGAGYAVSPTLYYVDMDIREHFDWLIYFRKSNPSRLLE